MRQFHRFTFWVGVLLLVAPACVSTRNYKYPTPNSDDRMRHGFWFGSAPTEAKAASKVDSASVKRGRALFAQHCTQCHGKEAEGNGPGAKTLKSKPADLKGLAAKFKGASFFIQVSGGKNEMPAWADVLTKPEIEDLSQYLNSLVAN